jgi:molecular chaperone GrpE
MGKQCKTTGCKKTMQLAEMKDLLQRTQASFENFRKQSDKRMQEMQEMAAKDVILELLPVVDNFELALKNKDGDGFVKGIELIYAQLNTLLEDNKVKAILTVGEEFDPHLHEALMKVPSDKAENIVVEEFQKGFVLGDKVIRCAKVKISAGDK